jgi:hypothetical protein
MLLLFHSRCALFVNKDVDLWDGVSGQEHYQPAAWIELPTTGGAHAGQRRPVEARELQLAASRYCPGALFILPQKQLRVYRKCTFYI